VAARRSAEGPTPGSAAADTPPADPVAVARTIVLRQLAAAPRSRAELAEALRRRDVPEEAAVGVLDRFEELGYVDDEAYAQGLVRARQGERGLARRALGQELRRRGVAPDVASAALEAVSDDDEEAAARRLVTKRAPSLAGLPEQTQLRRLVGMLGRKGYPPGLALRVAREAIEGDGERRDSSGAGRP
jgi:regulatory protein